MSIRSDVVKPRYRNRGFALIAVLGLLMVLSLVAAFIANYAEQRLEQTIQLRQQLQSRLDSDATLATLLHIVATRPLIQNAYLLQVPPNGPDGNEPLGIAPTSIDISQYPRLVVVGKPYRGVGQAAFSLQDEGSLLSLLDPDRERWALLFQGEGLSAQQAERFLDQLQDYTDQDNLRRVNGAIREDYASRGLALPPQRLMISPGQVFNLLDAPEIKTELQHMLPLMTTRSGQLHNINTMPQAVLQSIPGVDESLAQALIQERQSSPFIDLADANRRLGRIIPLDALATPSQASTFLRIQIWPDALACRQPIWLGLSSSLSSRTAPWEIDYLFTLDYEQPCLAPRQLAFSPLFE